MRGEFGEYAVAIHFAHLRPMISPRSEDALTASEKREQMDSPAEKQFNPGPTLATTHNPAPA
jgi:hypothetical protein